MEMIERRSLILASAYLAAITLVESSAEAFVSPPMPQKPAAAPGRSTSLQSIGQRSKDTRSDAVLVYRHGERVFEFYSGNPEPILLMSGTKSITSLAIGCAIRDGKIKSLDQPVYDYYPEMKQGRKAGMTVRHLLTMTSGISNTGGGDEVYPFPDYARLALTAELIAAPGDVYEYNNKAVNLLSGIIHIATAQPLDLYVRDQLFQPMGIESWSWDRDESGNASGMGDLALYPEDFAKFGLLMLNGGRWKADQLVPRSWVSQSVAQSQPYEARYGFLWWRWAKTSVGVLSESRVERLIKAGLNPEFAEALKRLAGKSFSSGSEWHHALHSVYPDWSKTSLFSPGLLDYTATNAPIWSYLNFDAFGAVGYLGQYLVVIPEQKKVAVRMIKPFDDYDYNTNRFEDFADVVRAIT